MSKIKAFLAVIVWLFMILACVVMNASVWFGILSAIGYTTSNFAAGALSAVLGGVVMGLSVTVCSALVGTLVIVFLVSLLKKLTG